MTRTPRLASRLLVLVALTATLLVPGLVTPLRAFSAPKTLSGSTVLGRPGAVPALGFAPTHIMFTWVGSEDAGVRFRTTGPGGITRWRNSWQSHDLEDGNRHYSGIMSVDRAAGIEWQPIGDASDVRLDYVNTLDGPVTTTWAPADAEASATTPDIVTRQEWGADESLRGCRPAHYPVQQLFVHLTVTNNTPTDLNAEMRAIYHFHTQSRGWCDIGYNFVIGPDGTIFEGRWARDYRRWETHDSEDLEGRAVAGAHVSGFNSGSVGVSLMGNYSQVRLGERPETRESLVQLLAWEADRHNLDPESTHTYRNPETGVSKVLPRIAGHRDAGATACPGDYAYRALPNIRRDVAAETTLQRSTTWLSLRPKVQEIAYGDDLVVRGRLKDEAGTPLPGRELSLFTRTPRDRWRRSARLVRTGLEGRYSFRMTPEKNTKVATSYGGDQATWESSSRSVEAIVVPRVRIAPVGGEQGSDGVTHYPAGTAAVNLNGAVLPAHPGERARVRIFRMRRSGPDLVTEARPRLDEAGRFVARFTSPVAGALYKARATFGPDDDHGRGRSRDIYFRADG